MHVTHTRTAMGFMVRPYSALMPAALMTSCVRSEVLFPRAKRKARESAKKGIPKPQITHLAACRFAQHALHFLAQALDDGHRRAAAPAMPYQVMKS